MKNYLRRFYAFLVIIQKNKWVGLFINTILWALFYW